MAYCLALNPLTRGFGHHLLQSARRQEEIEGQKLEEALRHAGGADARLLGAVLAPCVCKLFGF